MAPARTRPAGGAPLRFGSALAAALALTLALGSCATSSPQSGAPTPSAGEGQTVAAEDLGGETHAGVGPTPEFPLGLEIAIPAGAQSVTIDFTCTTGEFFQVEVGDSMMLGQSPLGGTCGEVQQLAWPLTDRTDPVLHITVGDDVEWTAETRFSTAAFRADAAVTADCATFSEIYSALVSADTGFTFYHTVDADDWQSRIDEAAAALSGAAETAESDLREQFSAVAVIVSDPSRTVGNSMAGAEAPVAAVHQACNLNQTPVITTSEFGG